MQNFGRTWLPILTLTTIAFWVSWPNLSSYFLGDDFAYVARFLDFPWTHWPRLFVTDWSEGMWQMHLPELRPMVALLYMIDGALWGTNPLGYHLSNMFLHLGASLWIYFLSKRTLSLGNYRTSLSFLAAALFLLHPSHAEPVAWIAGRTDLLGTFFYLGTVTLGFVWLQERRRWSLILAWINFFCGVFSKEFVLTAPLMLVAWAAFRPRNEQREMCRSGGVLIGGLVLIVLGYYICRNVAFEGTGSPWHHNQSQSFWSRQVTYMNWLLPPFTEQSDRNEMLWAWATTATIFGALVWFAPKREALFFGVIWYALATLPFIVTYVSARHLCLATAGMSLAIAVGLAHTKKRLWLTAFAAVGLLALSARQTHTEAVEWMRNGKISARISQAVINADTKRPEGTILILDVPPNRQGRFLWSWTTPFALRPPFTPREVQDVFEGPHIYAAPHNWATQKNWSRLALAKEVWMLSLDEKRMIQCIKIDQTRIMPSVARLQMRLATLEPDVAWQQFISELKLP